MKTWVIQPCTTKHLAAIYDVSYKVFRGHLKPFLKEIGKKMGHYFTMKQVMLIIERLGIPPYVELIYPPKYKKS